MIKEKTPHKLKLSDLILVINYLRSLSILILISTVSYACTNHQEECNSSHGCSPIQGAENNGTWKTTCEMNTQQELEISVTSHSSRALFKLVVFKDAECTQPEYTIQRTYSVYGNSDENHSNIDPYPSNTGLFELNFSTESKEDLQIPCSLPEGNPVNIDIEVAACIFESSGARSQPFNFSIVSFEGDYALLGETITLDGRTEDHRPTELAPFQFKPLTQK